VGKSTLLRALVRAAHARYVQRLLPVYVNVECLESPVTFRDVQTAALEHAGLWGNASSLPEAQYQAGVRVLWVVDEAQELWVLRGGYSTSERQRMIEFLQGKGSAVCLCFQGVRRVSDSDSDCGFRGGAARFDGAIGRFERKSACSCEGEKARQSVDSVGDCSSSALTPGL
jgi:hypothetical protein